MTTRHFSHVKILFVILLLGFGGFFGVQQAKAITCTLNNTGSTMEYYPCPIKVFYPLNFITIARAQWWVSGAFSGSGYVTVCALDPTGVQSQCNSQTFSSDGGSGPHDLVAGCLGRNCKSADMTLASMNTVQLKGDLSFDEGCGDPAATNYLGPAPCTYPSVGPTPNPRITSFKASYDTLDITNGQAIQGDNFSVVWTSTDATGATLEWGGGVTEAPSTISVSPNGGRNFTCSTGLAQFQLTVSGPTGTTPDTKIFNVTCAPASGGGVRTPGPPGPPPPPPPGPPPSTGAADLYCKINSDPTLRHGCIVTSTSVQYELAARSSTGSNMHALAKEPLTGGGGDYVCLDNGHQECGTLGVDNFYHGSMFTNQTSYPSGTKYTVYFDDGSTDTITVKIVASSPPSGNLDVGDCNHFAGWAQDPDTTDPIDVHVYMDGPAGSGTFVEAISAYQFRPDVMFHAFDDPTPGILKDGATHSVYFYAINSTGGINPQISGSPITLNCPAGAVQPIGNFETADCSLIQGWAYDPDTSSSRVTVEVWDDTTTTQLYSGPTNVPRPDINLAYGISGDHGFQFTTPASIKDGTLHSISVRALDSTSGTSYQIANSPANLNCAPAATAPTPPTLSAVDNSTCNALKFTWTDNSTNEDGFRVWRKTGGGGAPYDATNGWINISGNTPGIAGTGSLRNYTDPTNNTGGVPAMLSSTDYHYVVEAYNSGGSGFSNEVLGTLTVCQANLSGSSKSVVAVNGNPYNSATILKNGDILLFEIRIANSGPVAGTIVGLTDVPTANLINVRNRTLDKGTGFVPIASFASVTGSIPPGGVWYVQFLADISASSTSNQALLQNTATINCNTGCTVTKTFRAFSLNNNGVPEFREVAP